jgi:Zn-dependent protease with chaperone function
MLVWLLLPLFNLALIPETFNFKIFELRGLEVITPSVPIYLNREEIIPKALILYFILSLFLMVEPLVYSILINISPSLIFLRKIETKKIKDNPWYESCKKLASEIGIRVPKIFLIKVPEVRTVGCDEKNAVIALYEKCKELKREEMEPILAHEMAHIKFDLDYYTLNYILDKYHGKFTVIRNLVFLIISTFFAFETWKAFQVSGNINKDINNYFPFYIAVLSLTQLVFFMAWISHNVAYLNPVPAIEEIRADLVAFLHIGNINKFINALNAWRGLEIEYFFENPVPQRLRFYKIKKFFKKVFAGQRSIHHFSDWLEYLRQDVVKIKFIGRDIDFLEDRLRIDFLRFIDKLVNNNVRFRLLKKDIRLDRWWDLKFSFVASEIGLFGFKRNLNTISYVERAKIIEFLTSNLSNFNGKSCSLEMKVKLFNVIIVIVTLLIDGQIEYLGEAFKYGENEKSMGH